jgi:replicative DNA helicase
VVLEKLPPHDIAAEEAVVAACLVDSEAIYKIAPVIRPDDFFREKNAWVFDAIRTLWDRNEAINQITVAHELARRDRLEPVGGSAYLAQLVADLPTVVGVEYYAQIVARDAVYRRLIQAAGMIAQKAYEGGPELESVLGWAETQLMALRSGEALRDFVHIRTLLEKYLEDAGLEGEGSAGPPVIRTGFIDLDTLLGGLKRSDLVILAARPSMGKSALAAAFARNAAVAQKAKVAVFTLEMSSDQLAQRLLASEANVDSTRLRLGEHTEAEERRIMHAMGVLAACDIYIDDTPVMSVGEMRGKALRLQREHGLDLVLLDYLQLMQGSSGRNDNRVQEISMISRTLKTVAREMNVPLVALSQLSRAVESRTPHIPMLSDLRESGCLTGDALVALASGEPAPIASLVGQQPEVVTLDGWRMTTRRASKVWRTGHKPVFLMRTRTGRVIRATGNHQFRVLSGWQTLDHLGPGDRIALPRRYPEPSPALVWEPARVMLLAHLIGDGCYVDRQPLHYTSASDVNLQVVADAARSAFGIEAKRVAQQTWHHLYLSAGANKWHPNPIRLWLRELEIDGHRSHEKVLPNAVFSFTAEQIGLFLCHLWATDGCVHYRVAGRRHFTTIYYGTSSPRLTLQVQHLLARLSIASRIVRTQKQHYRPNFFVHVMGATDQLRFAQVVGGIGDREERLRQVVERLSAVTANTNADTIPVEVWDAVKSRTRDRGITHRQMTVLRGTAYGGGSHFKFAPSRAVLGGYASLLADPALQELATSDIYWDAVDSIEPDGMADVYDMTVPETHNFVANGIVVHNSIEQDADVVMFIYREDYYTRKEDWESSNPDRPSRSFPAGIAQVIIAKHRNGPVGQVDLRFVHKTAKFEDLMVRDDEPV